MRLSPLVLASAFALLGALARPAAAEVVLGPSGRDSSAFEVTSGEASFTLSGLEASSLDRDLPTTFVNDLALSGAGEPGGSRPALTPLRAEIPEPETYALMLAGLAALGVLRRRRPDAG